MKIENKPNKFKVMTKNFVEFMISSHGQLFTLYIGFILLSMVVMVNLDVKMALTIYLSVIATFGMLWRSYDRKKREIENNKFLINTKKEIYKNHFCSALNLVITFINIEDISDKIVTMTTIEKIIAILDIELKEIKKEFNLEDRNRITHIISNIRNIDFTDPNLLNNLKNIKDLINSTFEIIEYKIN